MPKKEVFILLSLVALKFILQQFLIDPGYDLQRDEYLHLDQANHLALGYTSVPPFTSWISYLIKLLGNGVFWVKFFPTLFGALTMIVVWFAIDEFSGNLYAKIIGTTCILFSCLLRLNTLYQPNSLDVLFWTSTFYFFIKYINASQIKWMIWTAVVFSFGMLNKYNIGFLALGLLPALIITKTRNIFLKKDIYIGMLIALCILFLNLLWQFQNSFPVIHHMNELAETQLVNVERLDFLKNQLLFFPGALIIILSGLLGLLFSEKFKSISFLFWSFVFTLGIFTLLRAKDYYAIGLYPIYIALGTVYLFELLNNKIGNFIKPVLLLFPVILMFLTFNIAYPNKTPEYIIAHQDDFRSLGLLRWEDGKEHEIPQDYADMLGWNELASKVDQAYKSLDFPEKTLVLCDNYGQAGAINYYTKESIHAVSFDADYVNWFDLQKKYKNLIRIKNRNERYQELKETSPYFETSIVHDSITNKFAREFGTTIFIFKNSKIDINKRIKEELAELKSEEQDLLQH